MPFKKDFFYLEKEIPAFLLLIRKYNFSQKEAQREIAKERLLADGKLIINSGEKIKGDIEFLKFVPKSQNLKPIFQTEDFLAFDKPSGLLVHPNTKETPYSLLDEIRFHKGDNAIHRIDMETSGLIIASKNKKAEIAIKMEFEERRVKKTYLAWVKGVVKKEQIISLPIASKNDYTKTKHKVFISKNGKISKTTIIPIKYKNNSTLLKCIPHTGRTHQIRIHLYSIGHPIIGDPLYGTTFQTASLYLEDRLTKEERISQTGANRLLLHSYSLEFRYKNIFFIKSNIDLN